MTHKHRGLHSIGRLPILAIFLVAMATAPAKAQTIREWNNPAGGPYDTVFNWSTFDVPDSISESAQFNIAGTYDVTLNSGVTTLVSDLRVFDGVTFNASGPASAIFEMDDDALILGNLTLSQAPGLGDVTLNVGDLLEIVGGSAVSVFQGSDVTAANLNLAIGGSGGTTATMFVDGVGSTLAVSTLTRLGSGSSIGTLTIQNGSTGNSLNGTVDLMANSTQAGSTGRLNVLGGSTLQTGDINVGLSPSASAIQEGTLTVDGTGSTLTMTGASTLTIGDDLNPNIVSDVIVSNSAVMSTGTGAILIQNSGHLDIQTGTFNANGNLTIDGGTVTRGSASDGFDLASGLTLTAQNTAQINFGGAYSIDQSMTFEIQSNADFATTGALNIGDAGGNGTLLVDGTGSSVTVGSDSSWGSDGNTANVTLRNAATGDLGLTHIAVSTTGGTTGILNVESGAVVTANTLTVAADGGATTSGTITVDGSGSSLAQEGAFDLVVGHATSGTATINVQNGGTFSTGTSATTVNPTGTINIGIVGFGTFNATGDLTVDGGTITRGSGTTGFNLTPGNTLTAKNDAQINFSGGYNLDQGTTFDIQSGADFFTTDYLDIGSSGDGTLLADGAGSSVTTGVGSYIWGNSGNTADVTFRNAAIGNLGEVFLANSPVSGTTGIFRVESGATVFANKLNVATGGGVTTSGTITVDGAGASLTLNGASALTVGHTTSGTATLNVQNGGTFATGSVLTMIATTGTVNVNTGSTFNLLSNILDLEGTINIQNGGISNTGTGLTTVNGSGTINVGVVGSGTFNANGNLTIDGGTVTRGSASDGFDLASGLTLTAQNTAQINFGGAYSIDQSTTFYIQSNADFATTGALNIGDAGGNGTLLVDGGGSNLTVGSDSIWGSSGNMADVTIRNGATGDLGLTHLAADTTGGTTSVFNVESGAMVTANVLTVAASGGATTSGTITVDGAGSSLGQEGAYSLIVGHATEGTATINVQNGGTFTTGSETTTVNTTGTINVGVVGLGTFNANNNITVDGGTITRGSSSNGFNLTPGNTLTATNNGQINFGGGYNLDQGTIFDIQSGADFLLSTFLDIGDAGGDGTLVVDGVGSSVTTGSGSSWGSDGSTADVTFRNAATGDLGLVLLAASSASGTTGVFRVESGATVTTDFLQVAASGGATTSGTVTVDGLGSSLTQNGSSNITIGHATSGTAMLNVQNSSTFTTGTGLTTIDTTGTVNVNSAGTFNLLGNLDLPGAFNLVGGTLIAVDPVVTSGELNFVFGTLELNSNQSLDPQRLAELDIESLDSGKTFRVNGVATLLTPLPLAGGTFTTESLVNPFLLDFQSGTFELTSVDLVVGPAGLFGSPLTVAMEQAIKVTNTTTVESDATLVIESSGTFMAGTLANAGSVVLNGPAATLGGTTFSNNAGGVVRGKGTISSAFNNNVGGELRGESGNTMLFTGTPSANAGQINLQGGIVQFAQSLTNAAGGQIAGRGTLNVGGAGLTNNGYIALSSGISDIFGDVSNDTSSASIGITVSGNADVTFWDDVQNSSGRFQVSSGSSATFFGAFAGNGITGTGDVFMEADITPGFSPGAQDFGGNVYFGPVASLEIEIAGLIASSEFDQINVASLVSLDGTLDVTFIDGFMPTAGDTFEIITAASVLDVFNTVNLPALPGDLLWFINYGATSVELVSTFGADFDEDGDVDDDDLTAWEGGFGSTSAVHMKGDTNADAVTSGFDFLTWQRQFGSGSGAPLAAATAIPEPSSLLLAAFGLITLSTNSSSRETRRKITHFETQHWVANAAPNGGLTTPDACASRPH